MTTIRTRFAPSPTGYLHVGGARTALFNWLYARHTGGTFVLRIEDTDAARSTKESVDAIFEGLEWLGIDWDEGPFFQSQRRDLYLETIDKLVETGHAYYCDCTEEALTAMREKGMAEGGKPKYDGTCREKGLKKGDHTVVRFKAPLTGVTVVEDRVKGPIAFQNTELDDFIIARSDGSPTYNFVVVVDDMSMNINHVIRGDDHVMNTPKQILLYKALGAELPVFAHVPMVLGADRTRLSKRHGATSVTAYRDMGFLPEAVVNYLARLGWSHGDQEFFTKGDLIEKFDIDHIGKSAGIFDMEKLTALNADHLMKADVERLAADVRPFLIKRGFDPGDDAHVKAVVETLTIRSKTFDDMAEQATFYYADEIEYEEKAAKKFLKGNALEPLKLLIEKLTALETFGEKDLEAVFTDILETCDIKLGKIAQPVRVALTGKSASPGIFEIIAVLGKEKVLPRLEAAREYIERRVAENRPS